MLYCADLDVSLKKTSIWVVDERRKVLKEGKVSTEPETIAGWLEATGICLETVGLEAGSLALALHIGLFRAGANAEEGLQLLVDGSVDAFSSDQVVPIGLVLSHEIDKTFVVSHDLFSFEPFALAVRRDDSAFRLVADRVLSHLSRSGQIGLIYGKWFGRFSKDIPDLPQAVYVLNATPE